MSRLIRFFTKILDICKLVPMLPVVVIAAIPLALLGDWRPWGNAMAIPGSAVSRARLPIRRVSPHSPLILSRTRQQRRFAIHPVSHARTPRRT